MGLKHKPIEYLKDSNSTIIWDSFEEIPRQAKDPILNSQAQDGLKYILKGRKVRRMLTEKKKK
jgi:hypothetical protein